MPGPGRGALVAAVEQVGDEGGHGRPVEDGGPVVLGRQDRNRRTLSP
ncbi:MAG: hypothetical protein ACRDVO_08845 [Jiangellaceae bacterium]